MFGVRSLALAFMGLSVFVPSDTEISDLGKAQVGRIDVFEIQVRNPVCPEPQNFRFVPRNLPWLKLIHGDRVSGVERGQTKTFSAEINLSGLQPGRYNGELTIVCETCAVPLSLCDVDKRHVEIKVEVIAALP